MDNDDRPVGRILSRREVLALFGAAGATALVGCAPGTEAVPPTPTTGTTAASLNPEAETAVATTTANPGVAATAEAAANNTTLPACIVSPEQTEGPYYADVQLDRSDIRGEPSDGSIKEGAPLVLTMRVSQINSAGCMPLAGAIVEIWHCDAQGVYSAFAQEGTAGQSFLRGYQITAADGTARFTTIYPGWYRGRTIHIHFKVRTDPAAAQGREFTSQLYFDDALSDRVLAQEPYAARASATRPTPPTASTATAAISCCWR